MNALLDQLATLVSEPIHVLRQGAAVARSGSIRHAVWPPVTAAKPSRAAAITWVLPETPTSQSSEPRGRTGDTGLTMRQEREGDS